MAPSPARSSWNQASINARDRSGMYNRKFQDGNWQTTLAWARRFLRGPVLTRFLWNPRPPGISNTVFARAENDERMSYSRRPPRCGPLVQRGFISLGYVYDVPVENI